MSKFLRSLLIAAPIVAGMGLGSAVSAQSVNQNNEVLNQLNKYNREGRSRSVNQVTNVNQLRDVSPADWAYEALRGLVERYGCISGFPNQTYRGNQALTRYEFAAGLNSCLNQIERLIASSDTIAGDDFDTMSRLAQEFEAEITGIGGRLDELENRAAFLEDSSFSTTTKLEGEVVFGLANEFNYDNQVVFQDRVRLAFVSSFTGEDALYTRLDAGNASTFSGIDTGGFTHSFDNGNNVEIGWLAYYFPIGDKIDVYLPAAYPLWADFAPTLSPYLDTFTGAGGSLSSFGESSPIYKIGLSSGGGIGVNFKPIENLIVSGGFFGGDSANPDELSNGGLFNDEYSALGQLTFSILDERVQLAATYVHTKQPFFDNNIFDLGVGTANARSPFTGVSPRDSLITNAYGVEAAFDLNSRIALNAFGMYMDADQEIRDGESEIWSYGLGIALPDFGKEGNLLGVTVGAEPYVGGVDDVPINVQGFYKYQMNDNISITPGVIWITAPNGDKDDDDAIIGVVRTTFSF